MISSVDFKELENKVIKHKASIDTSKEDILYNLEQIKEEQKTLEELTRSLNTLNYSYTYLDSIVKEESGKFIKKITEMLDYGVKTIFFDKDYSIDIRVTDNNKASIHLIYEDDNGILVEPEICNVGGGIRTVVGCLMQTYFIYLYKSEPVLFVDEGFSAISDLYVQPFFELLDELAKKNGFKILLVTHDKRFIDLSTVKKVYEVKDGHVLEIGGKSKDE